MRIDMDSIDKTLVHFLLLNGYSQVNVGLMHGKLGMSLSLFETSHLLNDELVEKYAYDLLQEAIASSTVDNSFDNGKAGIAWAILYLINNEYIDADYRELYTSEHDSIVEMIKNEESLGLTQSIDYLFFLLATESYILPKDFDNVWNKLINTITDSFAGTKVVEITYDCFYLNFIKIIGLYNIYKSQRLLLKPLVEVVIQTFEKLMEKDYVCDKLAFGVELLAYGMERLEKEIVFFADSAICTYFANLLIETLDYKVAVDILYYIERLSDLKGREQYQSVKAKVEALLQDKTSHLYRADRRTLSELQRGIARYVWLLSSNVVNWTPEKHVIMLH